MKVHIEICQKYCLFSNWKTAVFFLIMSFCFKTPKTIALYGQKFEDTETFDFWANNSKTIGINKEFIL